METKEVWVGFLTGAHDRSDSGEKLFTRLCFQRLIDCLVSTAEIETQKSQTLNSSGGSLIRALCRDALWG